MKNVSIILLLVLSCSLFTSTAAQTISTFAGNGYNAGTSGGGYSGDGGTASAAEFNGPAIIVFDKFGNLYIDDGGSGRIRKITASTGIISTVAGGGLDDVSVAGTPATATGLSEPTGIALDDSGNIYIADYQNYVVCKVTVSTGILTVVAGMPGSLNFGYYGDGGPATAALLDEPEGVALDDTGNIYIADYYNNAVRKVTISTGIITTVVGNEYGYYQGFGSWTGAYYGDGGPATAAELYGPDALTLDSSNNIYIADASNNAIRKVTASTGIITTIAGTGVAGNSGDGVAATTAKIWFPANVNLDVYNNIYFGDAHSVVREVTVSTGIINIVAGNNDNGYTGDGGPATAAELYYPDGVAFDTIGNMYIADAFNNVIRKVTPDTNIATATNKLIDRCEEVSVYPNPSNGVFNLYLSNVPDSYRDNKCNVEIYNVMGEKVFTETLRSAQGDNNIDLSNQSNGVYLYRVISDSGALIGEGKVVIEK